jgi:mitotic spindle assembly checkpoint protein MAD2B
MISSEAWTLPPVEVAIHAILYVRQVYPADLFVRRKKYDTPVFQSRHPSLNEYISGAVKAIGEELVLVYTFQRASEIAALSFLSLQGNVDKVVVVIKDKNQIALERFIFSVQNMIEVEPYNKDTRFTNCIFWLYAYWFFVVVLVVFRKPCPLPP